MTPRNAGLQTVQSPGLIDQIRAERMEWEKLRRQVGCTARPAPLPSRSFVGCALRKLGIALVCIVAGIVLYLAAMTAMFAFIIYVTKDTPDRFHRRLTSIEQYEQEVKDARYRKYLGGIHDSHY